MFSLDLSSGVITRDLVARQRQFEVVGSAEGVELNSSNFHDDGVHIRYLKACESIS
jgi:hypothetical protein